VHAARHVWPAGITAIHHKPLLAVGNADNLDASAIQSPDLAAPHHLERMVGPASSRATTNKATERPAAAVKPVQSNFRTELKPPVS